MSRKNRDELLALTPSQLRDLADSQSRAWGVDAHGRRMFASGFRKGFKAAQRNERSLTRAHQRRQRGRNGDSAWAEGFKRGALYIPRGKRPRGPTQPSEADGVVDFGQQQALASRRRREELQAANVDLGALTDRERRRLLKRGRL